MSETTYTVGADGKSITCRRCGMTSHNLNDAKQRYCGHCHRFHHHPGGIEPPRSIAALDAKLLPLIEAAETVSDTAWIELALRVRMAAFEGGVAGRYFFDGFVRGACSRQKPG